MKSKIKSVLKSFKAKASYEKVSYSQCGEDLIIGFVFKRLGISKPTYIDIGAHHPFKISNTALFYKSGARGINIEPDPVLFEAFIEHRKEDVNINIGIGDTNSEEDFYIISSSTLNTFSKTDAENYSKEGNYKIKEVKKIQVKTLPTVLNENFNGEFPQFLSLDAEGIDELVIKSIDFEKNYPLVICVETISFSTSGQGVKNQSLIDYIASKGYLIYADTYINTIFVRESLWRSK
ncbi:FkbM family methyltransferase [Psychroserpens sp. SPM9]|uniref:FkbM family methyltransferase n=1 Tax=Psychroserpens sp. SPM9 TaxID=2975598 RepID=UPI0021A70B74|nr:FkbM family methyltransferase [Psychroserpens sp. SPM9]